MGGRIYKYEYSYILAPKQDASFAEIVIAICDEGNTKIGVVYAFDLDEAKSLAWSAIPYNCTLTGVREIYY